MGSLAFYNNSFTSPMVLTPAKGLAAYNIPKAVKKKSWAKKRKRKKKK